MNTEALLAWLRADLEADDVEHADVLDPQLGRMITTAVRSADADASSDGCLRTISAVGGNRDGGTHHYGV